MTYLFISQLTCNLRENGVGQGTAKSVFCTEKINSNYAHWLL